LTLPLKWRGAATGSVFQVPTSHANAMLVLAWAGKAALPSAGAPGVRTLPLDRNRSVGALSVHVSASRPPAAVAGRDRRTTSEPMRSASRSRIGQ
jgi:hypothetical protein